MKSRILFIVFVFSFGWAVSSSAENANINKGNERFKMGDFGGAIPHYKKELIRHPDNYLVIQKLADCYRLCDQYDSALYYYRDYIKNVRFNKAPETVKSQYVDMLLRTRNFEEAKKLLNNNPPFNLKNEGGLSSERLKKNILYADSLSRLPEESPVKNMVEFNTNGSEYGVGKYLENVVFASNRTKENKIDPTLGFVYNFSDLYMSRYNFDLGMFEEPELMKGKINSIYNDGTFTFSPQSNWAYITQCKVKPELCAIYKSKLSGSTWTDVEQVKAGPVNADYGHPAVTSDGEKVYFSSNRPGGIGKKDIWEAKVKLPEGTFYDIKNMGPAINTDMDELFPYIIGDTILLFTSTGHTGMGGYDIFMTNIKDGIPGKPVNLGSPLNSPADDFSCIVNDNLRGIYFSSNRNNTVESDDINFHTTSVLPPLRVKVLDITNNNPLEGAVVTVLKDDIEIKDDVKLPTDKTGYAVFKTIQHLKCDADSHKLVADHINYISQTKKIPCFTRDEVVFYLKPSLPDSVLLKVKVIDLVTKGPVEGAEVKYSTSRGLFAIKTTLKDGTASQMVPRNQRIKIEVSKKGYFTSGKEYPSLLSDTSDEFGLQPLIPIIRVFFDFDKYTLRPQSTKSLDSLVTLFKFNPDKRITIESHADQMGSLDYNKHLSFNRGNAVYKYLVSHGVNKYLLDTLNYGETRPVISDPKTPDDYQLNRRTEFKAEYLKPVSSVKTDNYRNVATGEARNNNVNPVNVKPEGQISQKTDSAYQMSLGMSISTDSKSSDSIQIDSNVADVKVNKNGSISKDVTNAANPDKANAIMPGTTVYKIQIAALSKPVDPVVQFGNNGSVKEYGINERKEGGMYKYQVGNFISYTEAESVRNLLRNQGFPKCFIVEVKY
jgi:outer membrane protein OmpA-like peptidoglycan-associated protein